MALFDDWDRDAKNDYTADFDEDTRATQFQDHHDFGSSVDVSSEPPIFSLKPLSWSPTGELGRLVSLSASNDTLVIGTDKGWLVRWNLTLDQLEEIVVSKRPDDKIYKVFLDPTGNHTIITCQNGANYYVHSSKNKVVSLQKFKKEKIECVAWDRYEGTSSSTHKILLGTEKCAIYETTISSSGKESYFKQVYELKTQSENDAICGLQVEVFPPSHVDDGAEENIKYFVTAVTPRRLYQFVGGPTFETMFTKYESNPAYVELPGSLDYSELHFYSRYTEERARTCSWLTGVGIYFGSLVFGSQNAGDVVIQDYTLISYPSYPDNSGEDHAQPPLSISNTEFHFLLLYKNRFVCINHLNEKVVFDLPAGRTSGFVDLSRDTSKNTNWCISDKKIYQILADNEDRDVWKLYLDDKKFNEALEYCKTMDQEEEVLNAEADYHFKQGSYGLAAEKYAQSQRSFEEVALKFVNHNARDALMKFLVCKLKNISPKDKTQQTIICTWLTEIYLDKITNLKDAGDFETYEDVVTDFRNFIYEQHEHLNRNTTFELISSHGRVEELLHYAEVIEDLEWVISHHIQQGAYHEALEVLRAQKDHGKIEELYYKFCPILMHYIPRETVDMLINISALDPCKLIPALMRYTPDTKADTWEDSSTNRRKQEHTEHNHAIRYLEHCVNNRRNTDPAIHNYLISLYAKEKDEEKLLKFIRASGSDPVFDEKYALRLCHQEKKKEACVNIYRIMGLYEEAVRLALTVNLQLAKEVAESCDGDDQTKKNLWLLIGRHVVEKEKDISKAIAILNVTDFLKIEDILPFFPDFVRIGDFKKEICDSLDEYNNAIEKLKTEMEDYTSSANLIRKDIAEMRNHSAYVTANQKCNLCAKPVLSHQFYLFPCSHVFHADCIVKHVSSQLKQMNSFAAEEEKHGGPDRSSYVNGDTILDVAEKAAQECIFCGELMIESVSLQFVSSNDSREKSSWAI